MDDNITYWIIIGAIWLLSSLFGKKKKKPVARRPVRRSATTGQEEAPVVEAPTPDKDARNISFEDILRELAGETAVTPEPEPPSRPVKGTAEQQPEPAPASPPASQEPAWQVDEMDKIASRLETPPPLSKEQETIRDLEDRISKLEDELEKADPYKIKEKEGVNYLDLLYEPQGPARAFVMSEIFRRKF